MSHFIRTAIAGLIFATSSIALAGPVNVNTADAKTLAKELNGVGRAKAEMIVAYRQQNGRIDSADELQQVKGIGRKTIDKNREFILVD